MPTTTTEPVLTPTRNDSPGTAKGVASSYESHFARIEQGAATQEPASLSAIRKAAFDRFSALGFPTTRHEEWRFTNVSSIEDTAFAAPGPADEGVAAAAVASYKIEGTCGLLVFVNGRFAENLSELDALPEGVTAGGMARAMRSHPELLEAHLGRHASFENHAFCALNTALREDVAFVHVARGQVVSPAIQVMFLTTPSPQPVVTHPRMLIVAEPAGQLTVIQDHVGLGSEVYFTNAVTEIVAEDSAVVDHYKITREAERALHVSVLQIRQQTNGHVTSHAVTLSGRLVRNDINTVLDGDGGECTLNGLYVAAGEQHVDNHLIVDHARPHCDSREFFKGVLDDRSRGVFSGRIIVRDGAQKTDAKQTNQSLLLSRDARVKSKPQLEILADDVKCTHGATIGQISEEAVFYLRSRGLTESAARNLLIYAFAKESLDVVKVEPLRNMLECWLSDRLRNGRGPRESQ